MKIFFQSFYRDLLKQDRLISVIEKLPYEYREQALTNILSILDYVVWKYIVEELNEDERKTFVQYIIQEYGSTQALIWLEAKKPGMEKLLTEIIERTILSIVVEIESAVET